MERTDAPAAAAVEADQPLEQQRAPFVEAGGPSEIGGRVTSILSAAEDAAAQILEEARLQAEELRANARARAEQRAAELTADAEQLRREGEDYARDLRLAVEAYATQHRREAEETARATVADAERVAKATAAKAEERVLEIDQEAARRGRDLREEIRVLEERRDRVLDGLRDIALELQDYLPGGSPPRHGGDTLPDALAPHRRGLGRRN